MRVLFVNGRKDAAQLPGGDNIQMEKTRQALQELGVSVEVRALHELDRLPRVDLAHIFNIQMPETTWQAFQALTQKGIPTVLSPIYWDMYEYWSEEALASKPSWMKLAGILGRERVRQLYIAWQHQKGPLIQSWRLQRRLLSLALRVLPNSQSEADHLEHSFWLNNGFQAKVDIVPNAIDTGLYAIPPEPSREFFDRYGYRDFVLQVGTIYPVKNQLGLLEAALDLPVPLVFIGQVMEARSAYAEACKALALRRGHVVFVDRVDHAELRNIYALAAVHALPSWRETPGLVSLEAAAAGCRVVTTSIGSTRDYFGDQAFYCHPAYQASIRSAVQSALDAQPNASLRQRILAEYTWQRAAQATLDSYHKALA